MLACKCWEGVTDRRHQGRREGGKLETARERGQSLPKPPLPCNINISRPRFNPNPLREALQFKVLTPQSDLSCCCTYEQRRANILGVPAQKEACQLNNELKGEW
jgi:hypothetical protein